MYKRQVLLRVVGGFRMGDLVRVGEHFGRVSERGLFHTEIQNEDRELTTIPNLYLVTHPVTTVRASGTIVSTRLSLGSDVPRAQVETLLLAAAGEAGLSDPFVQVKELGDFSVTSRVAGLLTEVKRLISARSRLRQGVLDSLHEGGVEIVSPTFMNTRAFAPESRFIPRPQIVPSTPAPETSVEDQVFDKAEEAESLESLRLTCNEIADEIKQLEEQAKEVEDEAERNKTERRLEVLQTRRERLLALIERREQAEKE